LQNSRKVYIFQNTIKWKIITEMKIKKKTKWMRIFIYE